jgi:imidazolonepropionase-like amidohydrolase
MQLVLTGGRIWDGVAAEVPPERVSIFIDRGEITSIEPGVIRRPDIPTRSIEGQVAIPGLIDAHVHMDLDPTILKPEDQLTVSSEDRDLRMIARAGAMVKAGITTARDLGSGEWRELALRDAIARGELLGPRLVCAGQPVTVPDGHCHFWGGVAANAAEQAQVVSRQIEHAVDWIKVMATGGGFTKGSGVTRAQFREDEIRSIVQQAASAGRPVAAHCHGTAGIRNAARGGVRTIEHCSFAGKGGFGVDLNAAVVDDIARSGAFVSPTVNGGWSRRIEHEGSPSEFYQRMTKVLVALRRAGIPLIASTDAGIPGVHHNRLAAGIAAFARYAGLEPVEALRSATSKAAVALGLETVCGSLRSGLSADILVLAGDPLSDLTLLEAPTLVVARGEVIE